MKHNVLLTITSLLTILFGMFHLTDDIVRGMFPGGLASVPAVVVMAVWVYATLLLAERRSGYLVILVLSLFSSYLPVIHMRAPSGITAGIKSGGAFFFVWTLLALGVTAILSVILSARGLWSLRRGQPRTERP
jgi:hypothetical protein